MDVAPRQPNLPPGSAVELPGRGTTWVYDSGPVGDPRRPALLLLHGWTSTAALNFCKCFAPLASRYRVVALDHRGHGRGVRSRVPFQLEACADDAAALVETMELGPVTAVGYSMGGPVAQLMWRRHPALVDGLVLCATAARFATRQDLSGPLGALGFGASMALSFLPSNVRRQGMSFATRNLASTRGLDAWAVDEWGRADPSALIQAGLALGRFDSTGWLNEIDVPVAVVVTAQDVTVSPRRQWRLAQEIPGAVGFPVQGDHRACVDQARQFMPALLSACRVAQDGSFDYSAPVAHPTG